MSADSNDDASTGSVLDTWRRWYHIPALTLIALFMLWVRVLPYDNFVTDDNVYFSGNDAYYHFRTTMYSVENWPRTMYMDPWTHFPFGSTPGQFGTLFDLAIATVAMIVGLGSPTEHQVAVIAVLSPAVIGSLCVIPVFYIARRLTQNTIASLFGAFVFAILPTSIWLNRSTVGFFGHHVAENFLMGTTILALLVAVSVAQREKPVYEQLLDRDWEGLKPTVKWSALVGVSYFLYVWVWPPAVVIAGIIGTYFLVAIVAEVLRGNTPEHLAFAGAISMGVGGFLCLLMIRDFSFDTTTISFTQAFVPLVVAVGSVFLAWLARQWDQRDLEAWKYPVSVGAVGAIGVVGIYFLLPEAANTIWRNLQRTLLLGQGTGALTISEAQPMDTNQLGNEFFRRYGYGFTFLTALLAALWLGVQSYTRSDHWEEYLVVLVWAVFLTMMSITQVRFHYYLVSVVAVLNAYAFWLVYKGADFPSITSTRDIALVAGTAAFAFGFPIVAAIRDVELSRDAYLTIAGVLLLAAAVILAADYYGEFDFDFDAVESYHILIILLVAVVVVVPIASPVAAPLTATDFTERQEPGNVETWELSNDWLAENTPEPGNYGDATNADELEYYGTYEATDDYQYPEGAYGVMSWWDYGHWITVDGERIPNANPFQQGVRPAAEFLLTDDEQRAELLLDALPAGGSPQEMSNEQLGETVDGMDDEQAHEETRYVMIDHQMAGGKFPAITQWSGPDRQEFQEDREYTISVGDETTSQFLPAASDRYEETMLHRLYFDDADGLEHYRLVHETDDFAYVGSRGARGGGTLAFDSFRVENNLRDDGSWSEELGQIDRQLQAAEQEDQAVAAENILLWNGRIVSSVKTYERVEGATLTGEAPANSTVFVSVPLETNAERTTNYRQSVQVGEDGTFEVTVPYATDNELDTEDGYTDTAVETTNTYLIQVQTPDDEFLQGETEVSEQAVVTGDTIDVELEELQPPDDGDEENTDDGDEENTEDGDEENTDGSDS